ncbi:hypothetical protein GCM10007854_02090 [Algimonas porphyrae]|uniref:Transcriptional regulator n=1 Tax=Algimonas porphyrae TaxID=1128113 RepID=A0ABQ5UWH5_9PROT|nr:hypothetical protein GCM10007854_02090 [Algimonas porphyrae]
MAATPVRAATDRRDFFRTEFICAALRELSDPARAMIVAWLVMKHRQTIFEAP